MNTGKIIRNARASKKLTQDALAHRAGVSKSYIQKLEAGGYKPEFALMRIAKVLDIDIGGLIDG